MMNFVSSPAGRFATSAAVVSVGLALFVPYGHPWASLTWAVLACAAALWSTRTSDRMDAAPALGRPTTLQGQPLRPNGPTKGIA